MQTGTTNGATRGVQRWRLVPLLAGACATVALAGATAASPTKAPAPATTYRLIPLAPNGFSVDINRKGQVAFTEFVSGVTRARVYDGTTVRDLGTFGGLSATTAAINELGRIAGTATLDAAGEVFHAFRWSRQTGLIDLNRPDAGNSISTDINNKGQVVGTASFAGQFPISHAFRWSQKTGMVDLGSFAGSSVAFAINDAGVAVGYSESPGAGSLILATRWPPAGGPIALNSFPSIASVANDINSAGQIVGGAAFDAGLSDQAFIWTTGGGLRSLGTEGSYRAFAERINEKGLVIGDIYASPVDRNGFIWSRENGLLVIGTPLTDFSDAADVNNWDQVVGSLNGRAFVWTRAGGFVDLNSRIVGAPADLELFEAAAISDNGSIVASGAAGLFLLVPESAHHQPPVAGPVKFTGSARVNALLSLSAGFKDVDVRDTHKSVWSWGDGSETVGTVSEKGGTGSVSGQHLFRTAGIYTVRLTVTDSSGKSSTVERKVVVSGGAAATTGVGAFASPANAAATAAQRGAIGSFAFLAEGTDARRAAVEVNVAGMALRSSRVDAVTLDGARVRYSGQGTVNGKGSHRFTLTATSGAKAGGKDRIHVRIVHTEPGSKVDVVDYDNGAAAGTTGAAKKSAAAGAEGSVVIGEGSFEFGSR